MHKGTSSYTFASLAEFQVFCASFNSFHSISLPHSHENTHQTRQRTQKWVYIRGLFFIFLIEYLWWISIVMVLILSDTKHSNRSKDIFFSILIYWMTSNLDRSISFSLFSFVLLFLSKSHIKIYSNNILAIASIFVLLLLLLPLALLFLFFISFYCFHCFAVWFCF